MNEYSRLRRLEISKGITLNQELKLLREELEALRDQFTLKTMLLARKIENLEKRAATGSVSKPPEKIPAINQDENIALPQTVNLQQANPVVVDVVEPNVVPHKPAFFFVFMTQLLSSVFDWFSPLTKLYDSYKARGMLGIFFLTIAGAGLVLAGFGYLMQLLIDEMGAGSKSLLMSITAMSVIAGGIVLKVKTKFAEFASAIVALGLLLVFSTVYFVGSVYQLIPGLSLLLLYAITALTCHYLALWLDTKVIAVLGIIGISIMPLLSASADIDPTYYVIALLFVSASSLFIAHKHVGHWLAELTFAFAVVALGWIDAANTVFMSAWMINAFYLLFSSYIAVNMFLHKTPAKRYLVLQAAVLGTTLLLLLQGLDNGNFGSDHNNANVQLLINMVLSGALAALFYRVKHTHTVLMVLVAATWAVLTIMTYLQATYWGIAWAVEALLLIFMSRHYKLPSLIHQGQALAAVALVYCLAAVIPYFPEPALQSQNGWVIVLTLVLLVGLWQRLISIKQDNGEVYAPYVHRLVYPLLIIAESIWLSIIVLSCAFIWLGEWAGLTALLVQIGLLFRAKHASITATYKMRLELVACSLVLFPLAYAVMGSDAVNSMRFSALPNYAKASLIVAFIQLWLWSAFYRKFNPQSALHDIAERARILFYLLLPIVWLPTLYRRLDSDILMLLWLSPVIGMVLAHLTKAKPLYLQSKLLFAGLTLATLWFLMQSSLLVSSIGILAYLAIVVLAHALNKASSGAASPHSVNSSVNSQSINRWAINTVGLMLAILVGFEFDSLVLAHIVISVFSIGVISLYQRFALCAQNFVPHAVYLAIATILSWLLLSLHGGTSYAHPVINVLTPILMLASMWILKQQNLLAVYSSKRVNKHYLDIGWHTYLLVTYILLCLSVSHHSMLISMSLAIAPLLAIHGAAILFFKDRSTITVRYSFCLIALGVAKLAIIDAANVVLWQKVMLFIGIGVFILLASFWYQKLVSKDQEPADTN